MDYQHLRILNDPQGKPNLIEYKFVTDPNRIQKISVETIPDTLRSLLSVNKDDQFHIIHYRNILKIIDQTVKNQGKPQNEGKLIVKRNLSKGLQKFIYQIKYEADDQDFYKMIDDWIHLIYYPKLLFRLDESKCPILPGEQDDHTTVGQAENIRLRALEDLRQLLLNLIKTKEQITIRNVILEANSPVLVFTPYDENNRMIHVSHERLNEYNIIYPLQLYYGWRYLSDSPLTLYIIDNISDEVPIRKIDHIYIIPSMSRYNDVINMFEIEVRNLISLQYVSLDLELPKLKISSSSIQSDNQGYLINNRIDLYSHLIDRFNHNMITTKTTYKYIINEYNKTLFGWIFPNGIPENLNQFNQN